MRTRAIRIVVIVVCVLGVAGMIIASATNHNGAAVTFGLITAVAILCQMAMTTAVNEARGVPGAPITAIGSSPPPSPPPNPSSGPPPNPSSSPSSAPPAAPGPALDPVDTEAAALESRIADLVAAGVEEQAVRDLARQAVRLGRLTSPSGPPDS